MKKRLFPLILAVVLVVAAFTVTPVLAAAPEKPFLGSLLGGNDRYEQALPTGNFTVTYNANGGVFPSEGIPLSTPVTVKAGDKIDEPIYPPTMSGKVFEGWFLDTEGRALWDFDDPVYSNITLYAKFNDGVKLYVASSEQMTIYSDAVKYNSERATDIANALKTEVRAKYLGEAVETTVSNYGTFRADTVTKLYPVGEHNVTFRATVSGVSKTLTHKVKVVDGPSNRVYISTKASVQDMGTEAYGYFNNGRKDIGIALDHYFDLTNKDALTDYTVSNAVARFKLGLPRNLLSGKFTLKQFADPVIIHNNTGENVWYKLDTVEHLDASFVLFDESGAVIEGYDGPNRTMYSEKYYNYETRMTSANATFLTDREIPDGYFLLVIGHNDNKGNFYMAKSAAPSAITTYDYDGRKFALSAIMYHYKNVVEIRVGNATDGALLTAPYTNQMPYVTNGSRAAEAFLGIDDIDEAFITAGLEVYDDNGAFEKDRLVPASRITIEFAKSEGENSDYTQLEYSTAAITDAEEGVYYSRITVADNSDPDLNLIFYKKITMKPLVNNYSYHKGDRPFAHKHTTTEGVRFNSAYTPWGGVNEVVFVFDKTAAKYFSTYTAECQWSVILILKDDGSVVYAVSSQGAVYNSAGENIFTVSPQNNMFTNFYQRLMNTTVIPTDSIVKTFLTNGAGTDEGGQNGTYYLVIYPNAGGTNESRHYADGFMTTFIADHTTTLTIKGTGVSIGA